MVVKNVAFRWLVMYYHFLLLVIRDQESEHGLPGFCASGISCEPAIKL